VEEKWSKDRDPSRSVCMCMCACIWGKPWRLGSLTNGRSCATEMASAPKRGLLPAAPAAAV